MPSVVHSSTGNTITFTYTTAAGGMASSGTITVDVPSGWSAPSTTPTAAGYVTAGAGMLSVSGQTIKVSSLTLAPGATLTVVYGAKAAGGPGATAPATTGSQSWLTRQRSSAGGVLTALASSPEIAIT